MGINSLGQTVGEYCLDSYCSQGHGFVRSRSGGYVELGYPGAYWNALAGINDAGWIIGVYMYQGAGSYPDGLLHCALYKPNSGGSAYVPTTINEGTNGCIANGINGFGQIVGDYYSNPSGSSTVPFLYDGDNGTPGVVGNTTPLTSSASLTEPNAINNNGVIAGIAQMYYYTPRMAFAINGGQFINLPAPGGNESGAYGVNDVLQFSGWFTSTTSPNYQGLILNSPN